MTGTPTVEATAEESVLGAMLLSIDVIGDVTEIVDVEDFYDPRRGQIFATIKHLFTLGAPADAVTVATELAKTGDLDRVGGAGYLHTLAAEVPTAANAAYYARLLAQAALRRRLLAAATRIAQTAAEGTGDVEVLVDQAQEDIYAVTRTRRVAQGQQLGALVPAALDTLEALAQRGDSLSGVPTGFVELDRLTQGLQPGQMVVVAGRPAMGKSAFALNVLRAVSVGASRPCALFSLEMSSDEIVTRLLSAQAGVPMQHLRAGVLSEAEWGRLASAMPALSAAPLHIDDAAGLTMTDIRARCRRLQRRNGLDVVVIDYLQLLTTARRAENRQQEVSELSRSMKLLAKELEVPVVALSQLNRGPEQRVDKRPLLGDLRESGSIEQDADVVMLLHRPDAYDPDGVRAGEIDVIVAKHRNGPTSTVPLAFQGHFSRIADLAKV